MQQKHIFLYIHDCMSANAKTCREIRFIFPVISNYQNNFEFLQLIKFNVYHLLKYITVSAVDIVYFGEIERETELLDLNT